MNKIVLITGVAVIVIAATLIFILKGGSGKNTYSPTSSSGNKATNTASAKKACDLLTLSDAKTVIGDNATLSPGSGSTNMASSANVVVDNCSYSADGATIGDMKQLTLQIQSGNAAGVKQAYDNYKKQYPGDIISNLGDMAYYSTESKQVNVLSKGVWIFVAGGSINNGDTANKDLQMKAARIVLGKL